MANFTGKLRFCAAFYYLRTTERQLDTVRFYYGMAVSAILGLTAYETLGASCCKRYIVTKGNEGCLFQDKVYPTEDVPVKDISGAGDTFLAGLVVEYLKSNDIIKSIEFAQECTTRVVQKHGVSVL